MWILKYIINDEEAPILFDSNIMDRLIVTNAVSAGFVIIHFSNLKNRFEVKCFGESESLKVGFRLHDQFIIEDFLNSKFCFK